MNVNVKLSLTDDQRRALASHIAGKPVKRLATRADINAVVNELLAITMAGRAPKPVQQIGDKVADAMAESIHGDDYCSDDCCRQNQLLQSRVNVLQHRLDTGR